MFCNRSFKFLLILLTLLCLPLHAEEEKTEPPKTGTELPLPDITVTPQSVDKVRQNIPDAQAALKTACEDFQKEQQLLSEKALLLEFEEFTQDLLKESIQKRQDTNFELEQIRGTQQRVKTRLVTQRKTIEEWSTTLQKLKEIPDKEQTEAQKQFIPKLIDGIVLLAETMDLSGQYVVVLERQLNVAIQHAILTTSWHAFLQSTHNELLIEERQQTLESTQAVSKLEEEKLQRKQEEVPDKLTALGTAQATGDFIAAILEDFSREKETVDVEVKNLVLEQKNIEVNLDRHQKSLQTLEENLDKLKKTPPVEAAFDELHQRRITASESYLTAQKRLYELESEYQGILNQRVKQAEKHLEAETEWQNKVQTILQVRRQQELDAKLQEEQQRYLSQAARLRQELSKAKDATRRYLLEMQIQQTNELAQQLTRQLEIEHMEKRLQEWEKTVNEQKTAEFSSAQLENFQDWMEELESLLTTVHSSQESLQEKISVLEKQAVTVESRCEALEGEQLDYNQQTLDLIIAIKEVFEKEVKILEPLGSRGEKVKTQLTESYKKGLGRALFARRQLPTSFVEWQGLWEEYRKVPLMFMQQFQLAGRDYWQALQQTDSRKWITLGFVLAAWVGFIVLLRIWSARLTKPTLGGFANRLAFPLRLLHMNLLNIGLIGLFALANWLVRPNPVSIMIVMIILLVWLGGKLLINLTWLLLSEDFPKQAKVYRQLKIITISISLFSIVIALVHQHHEGQSIKLSLNALDMIDSVFMLLLLLSIWPIIHIRQAIFTSLTSSENTKGYVRMTAYLITFLIPLSIFTVSLLGLIGYLKFGWMVVKQMILFLLVTLGWLVVRGFVDDLLSVWQRRAQDRGHAVLAEDFIPLLDKIFGITLIAGAVMVLLYISGGASDVAFKEGLYKILNFPLFSVGSGQITLGPILLSFVLLWAVFWLGGWSRGVSYRWIYANIVDKGVRHSLSIFTQYIIVVVGLLIVLKSIGIDPTMLTVFAGAVGVGLGFGMQNVVNNFISGILLLIERPVRTGDFVNIKGSWGTVTRIGIRSLTMETPDKEEVLVPNSAVISDIFTNRTHSNTLLRHTFYVGVGYSSNLLIAINIIKGILDAEPAILKKPAHEILIWEFTDFRMTIRVNYFVDTAVTDRFVINSGVLTNVLAQFRAAGIEIPHPKEDINLKVVEEPPAAPTLVMPYPRLVDDREERELPKGRSE